MGAIAGMTRAGYETAPYTVEQADGNFEIREYPTMNIVETKQNRVGQEASNGFRSLFNYITGQNERRQNIAMTTPVYMQTSTEERTMAFVMPANMKMEEVPMPTNGQVYKRQIEEGRFAVLRFSGSRTDQLEQNTL